MSATMAIIAKGRIIDRLTVFSAPGQELDGVQVAYAFEGDIGDECIYGGRVVFEQPGVADVADGTDVLNADADTFWLYARVVGRGMSTRQTYERAAEIGDVLSDLLKKDPMLVGPNTWTNIAGGTGDHQQTDDGPIVNLAYRVTTAAYV